MQKIDNGIDGASTTSELPGKMTFSYRPWWLAFSAIFPTAALCAALHLEYVIIMRQLDVVFLQLISVLCAVSFATVSWSYVRCLCQTGDPIIVLSDDGILYRGSELLYKKQFVSWSEVGSLEKKSQRYSLDIVIHFRNPNGGKHWTRMPVRFLRHDDVLSFATRYLARHEAIHHRGQCIATSISNASVSVAADDC